MATLDSAQLLAALEPTVEDNLNRHLAAAQEWMPHEYVPWSQGRDFFELGGEPWSVEQSPLSPIARTALEVNLRKGGTTHPFSALRSLVPGRYDAEAGAWLAESDGSTRAYRSTDNLLHPSLAERSPQSVIDAVREAGLQFDTGTGTGAVLHMLGCLAVDGRLGLTAIGRTPEHAEELYSEILAAVLPAGAAAVELTR